MAAVMNGQGKGVAVTSPLLGLVVPFSLQERELDEAFSNIHEVDDMDGHDRMSYHSSQEMGKASISLPESVHVAYTQILKRPRSSR